MGHEFMGDEWTSDVKEKHLGTQGLEKRVMGHEWMG